MDRLRDALDTRQSCIPHASDAGHSRRGCVQPLGANDVANLAPLSASLDETDLLQHRQMLHHGLPRDGQAVGKLGGGRVTPFQEGVQETAPAGFRDSSPQPVVVIRLSAHEPAGTTISRATFDNAPRWMSQPPL